MQFEIMYSEDTEFNFEGLPYVKFDAGVWYEFLPFWSRFYDIILPWAIENRVKTRDLNKVEVDTSLLSFEESEGHISKYLAWVARFDM